MSDTRTPEDTKIAFTKNVMDHEGFAVQKSFEDPSDMELTVNAKSLEHRGNVFFAAVEMTRMPMVLTDPNQPDNPIVFANHAFEALTGYKQSEIVGRNCRFLQGSQSNSDQIDELRSALSEKRATSVELLNYKKDGTPFWNGIYIAPVFDKDGSVIFFFASQLDISRRYKSEQDYRQIQKDKMESIGQLTAGIAHDFNNLLQVVTGNMELLRGHLIDDRLNRHLDNAANAADRGAKLTRQLLAFASKARLEPKIIDLNALLNDCGDILESTAGSQIELILTLRRRLPPSLVDSEYLERAILNVLVNARDSMPSGGTITIATALLRLDLDAVHRSLMAGTYVVLSVTDTGEGMSADTLKKAVEPFFTTKPIDKGTGLGLAMVHGFVQQSGGQLEIDSEIGKGTTVRMIFPALSEVAVPQPVAAPQSHRRNDPRGMSETILIVEDNNDVLILAREHLQDLGYNVLSASNGEEALNIIENDEQKTICLLFTDVVMPGGIDGLMLAEKVSQRLPDLPILFATGYTEELVAEDNRTVTRDVLGKPYNRSALADRVHAALKKNNSAKGRDTPTPPMNKGPRHEG